MPRIMCITCTPALALAQATRSAVNPAVCHSVGHPRHLTRPLPSQVRSQHPGMAMQNAKWPTLKQPRREVPMLGHNMVRLHSQAPLGPAPCLGERIHRAVPARARQMGAQAVVILQLLIPQRPPRDERDTRDGRATDDLGPRGARDVWDVRPQVPLACVPARAMCGRDPCAAALDTGRRSWEGQEASSGGHVGSAPQGSTPVVKCRSNGASMMLGLWPRDGWLAKWARASGCQPASACKAWSSGCCTSGHASDACCWPLVHGFASTKALSYRERSRSFWRVTFGKPAISLNRDRPFSMSCVSSHI
jgi:hypothetical protein